MTDPTMAALDAAVEEARDNFANALAVALLTADASVIEGKISALIAAAEARGAERERARECVMRRRPDKMNTYERACDGLLLPAPRRGWCARCGGRVRVEEVGDAMP